jgi:hypothetical protein
VTVLLCSNPRQPAAASAAAEDTQSVRICFMVGSLGSIVRGSDLIIPRPRSFVFGL